jgi:predicted O-methyltransferase YrrM
MKELDIWHNIYELRGTTHGHMPLTKNIIDFFKRVSKKVKPKNILEFGTNLGGSAALQLTLNPKAKLVSFDPKQWEMHSALYMDDSFIKQHPKIFGKIPAPGLLHIVFGTERFRFINRSSKWVQDLVEDKFDYAFIDGSHTYLDCYNDIQNCIELEIPYLVVDNIATDEDATAKRVQVKAAVEQFANQLEEIDSVEYEIVHPITEKVVHDKCILFKVNR